MYNMRERQKIADSNASQNPQFCFLKEQINQEGNSLWGSIWISFHLISVNQIATNCSLNQLGGIVHILTLTLFDSTTVPLFPIPSGPYFTLYPTSIPWSFLAIILPPSP